MKNSCPLCKNAGRHLFWEDRYRPYFRCDECQLIYVPLEFHIPVTAEKAEYELHQNSPDDPGYRQFLSRLFEPLNEKMPAGSYGLDFGSGPGPTLSVMFSEAAHHMELFDKFYSPDEQVLNKTYDFITATEVLEHLRNPHKDLERLWKCLKINGWLGIMTKLVLGQDEFKSWHYKNELTHINFFSKNTFRWLADQWNADVTFVGKDVVFIHKKGLS